MNKRLLSMLVLLMTATTGAWAQSTTHIVSQDNVNTIFSGVGHVALRYSDNVTFDGCTVYTKNNGGSSCCALTGSHDCTFKDTHFETAGSAGNTVISSEAYAVVMATTADANNTVTDNILLAASNAGDAANIEGTGAWAADVLYATAPPV